MDTVDVLWLVDGGRTASTVHVPQHCIELHARPPMGGEAGYRDLSVGGMVGRILLFRPLVQVKRTTYSCGGTIHRQRVLFLPPELRTFRFHTVFDFAADAVGAASWHRMEQGGLDRAQAGTVGVDGTADGGRARVGH